MPAAVIAQALPAPPPPAGPVLALFQPVTGVATIVFPWGTTTTNAVVTGLADTNARIAGAVL